MNNEENRILEFDAVILQNGSMDAAYVEVPYSVRADYWFTPLLMVCLTTARL